MLLGFRRPSTKGDVGLATGAPGRLLSAAIGYGVAVDHLSVSPRSKLSQKTIGWVEKQ